MNNEQKKICKVIDKAFSQLHILSNITWTPYRDKIVKAWVDQDLKYLADLDYIALIDWKHHTEILERRSA